jgi:nitric oxide synthase oxygenase domain/subunit
MNSWDHAHKEQAASKSVNKSQAEMKAAQGVEQLKPWAEALIPLACGHKSPVPSEAQVCENFNMFGYTETMTSYDVDPLILGSVHWIFKGSLSVVVVAGSQLQEHLAKVMDLKGEQAPTTVHMKLWLEGLEQTACTHEELTKIALPASTSNMVRSWRGKPWLSPPATLLGCAA